MSAPSSVTSLQSQLQRQLVDRRARLARAISHAEQADDLVRLLGDVDAALSGVEAADFGRCSVCHEEIEERDLLANPMAAYCLCKLSSDRQRALEHDLDLAWRVQAALLPIPDLSAAGWRTHYRYVPHGPVSGDYCDLIAARTNGDAGLYFMLGDVSGKGVAASLLMAHLNASFRALAPAGLPPDQMVSRANRLLTESTLTTHYATLVCGYANLAGEVQIVNAGHCPPVMVRANGDVEVLTATGLPLGLGVAGKPDSGYAVEKLVLGEGDTLVLYTDGLTEVRDANEEEYSLSRLSALLARCSANTPQELINRCLADVALFLNADERTDDLTILAIQRAQLLNDSRLSVGASS